MKYVNSFYKSLLLLNLAMVPSAALAVEPVIDGDKTATVSKLMPLTTGHLAHHGSDNPSWTLPL